MQYASLLVFPLHLSYDYSFNQILPVISTADPRFALVLVFTASGAAVAIGSFRRAPQLFYAVGFGFATLSVVSNLVLPIGTILGERLLYLPSVGFCFALALALRWLTGRRARAYAALTAVVVALHAARAFDRNADWRSEDSIWLHDVAVVPRSARAQSNAGAALERQGRCEEALPYFEAAISIGLPPEKFVHPYQGRALCLAAVGRYAEAAEFYEVVVQHGAPNPDLERRIRQGLRERRSP